MFDYDRKGHISRSDFEEDRNHIRQAVCGEKTFEQLDTDSDGLLTAADFAPGGIGHLNGMLSAIENGDDEWLKNNHGVRLTSAWFREHFSLEPNKTVMPKLEIPIHIFTGEYDMMTPQFYAKDIGQIFTASGKTNLTVHCFVNHDHDLNYMKYMIKNEMSDGIKFLLETAADLS